MFDNNNPTQQRSAKFDPTGGPPGSTPENTAEPIIQPAAAQPVETAPIGTQQANVEPNVEPTQSSMDPTKTGFASLQETPAFDPTKPLIDPAITDQETIDLFKRAKPSAAQRGVLFFVVGAVIALFIGGGIVLYSVLRPFDDYQSPEEAIQDEVAANDADRDGLPDVDEVRAGTSKDKADSDNDQLNDYDEVKVYKTKPTVPDSDGDGYVDGDEVLNGYDPNGPGRL